MKVLYCPVNRKPQYVEIPNELKAAQKLVGGYIETVTFHRNPQLILVCNEEGLLEGLPINTSIPREWNLTVGNAFICGVDGEEFTSVPEKMQEQILKDCTRSWEQAAAARRKKNEDKDLL